jgi:hypothetical protein
MKNLKELKGVKVLSKTEQKAITGGIRCDATHLCSYYWCCINNLCTYCE